ncbi:MAG: hypothetical protein EHM91_15410 [Planctomycetota bacterium]|nr:MAG: hypothetical protein EHM91_15410 [Planctomycetota bacterium]
MNPDGEDQSKLPLLALALVLLQPPAADTIRINSNVLGEERTIFVSVPASHARTSRSYPVILLFDGDFTFADGSEVAHRLARIGHIPESIVVGLAACSGNPMDHVRSRSRSTARCSSRTGGWPGPRERFGLRGPDAPASRCRPSRCR